MTILVGNSSKNTLNGSANEDLIIGNCGNDILNGKAGDDTYIFNLGDGNDTITDSSGTNIVQFGAGIISNDLSYSQKGNDLIISVNTLDSITIKNYFLNNTYKYNELRFFNNSIVSSSSIDQEFATITGTAGKEKLYGTRIDNEFTSSAGNDTLYGGSGDDVYVFESGHGTDRIVDTAGNDTISLEGFDVASFYRSGNDLIFNESGSEEKFIVSGWFTSDANKMEYIIANGNIQWTLPEMIAEYPTYGNDTANIMNGTNMSNSMEGFLGNDTLNGKAGDDTLKGSDDNDILNGDSGNDSLAGGTGNDTLYGGADNDTYYFITDHGNDYINDISGNDTLNFGDKNNSVVTYQRDGYAIYNNLASKNNLYINTSDTDKIVMANYFSDSNKYGIENVVFQDASATLADNIATKGITIADINGNNILSGTSGNDSIYGGTGNDSIYGTEGKDSYIYNYNNNGTGDGIDLIYNSSINDTLYINGPVAGYVTYAKTGNDLTIQMHYDGSMPGFPPLYIPMPLPNLLDSNNSITLKDWFVSTDRLEKIVITNDSTTVTAQNISAFTDLELTGTSGSETITGTSGNDFIELSAGSDRLEGDAGDDVYYYGLTSGFANASISDISGNDTLHFLSSTNIALDSIRFLKSGNDLTLDNGNWDHYAYIKDWFASDSNTIENFVFESDNTTYTKADILAKTGLLGTSGNDSFIGGSGTNYMYGMDGADTIYGMGGDDYIMGYQKDDLLNGGDGDDLLQGNENNDTLYGENGSDSLTGGTGNDFLYGGNGNDTYHYTPDDGLDIISDTSGNDTLQLNSIAGAILSKDSNDLVISYQSQDIVRIQNYFSGAENKIEHIKFTGNTVHPDDVLLSLSMATASADTIYGSDYNDDITALAGNDTVYGYGGNDKYRIASGHGKDYIYETSGNDTISFGYNDLINNVEVVKSGNDLIVNYLNTTAQQTGTGTVIKNYFTNADNRIDVIGTNSSNPFGMNRFIYTDNMKLGNSGNDSFVGDTLDNAYFGNGGKDKIYDFDGNDSYYIKAGSSYITDAGDGDDLYVYYAGKGNDTISDAGGDDSIVFYGVNQIGVSCGLVGNDLKIILSANDSITIKNWLLDSDNRIDHFYFDPTSNTSMSASAITFPSMSIVEGTSGNNLLTVGHGIYSGEVQEFIIPDEGNDTIQGYYGDDTVYDKDGNDYYKFAVGDEHDTITDLRGNDTFNFSNMSFNNLNFTKASNDMIISYGSSDDITVKNWFVSVNNRIENISFNGNAPTDITNKIFVGTTGKNTLTGTSANEYFYGHAGNDSLYGGEGNDFYYFAQGDGRDTIADSDGNNDRIRFNSGVSSFNDLDFLRSGNNMIINYGSGSDKITVKDWFVSTNNVIDWLNFGNTDNQGREIFAGTTGNDTLIGTDSQEVFYGQAGSDSLCGGSNSSDTYYFSSGDGIDTINDSGGVVDRIVFKSDVVTGKIALYKDGSNNLIVDYGKYSGKDRITVQNNTIEKIELGNGKYLDTSDINNIISYITSYDTSHANLTISSVNNVKSNAELMTYIATQWHS